MLITGLLNKGPAQVKVLFYELNVELGSGENRSPSLSPNPPSRLFAIEPHTPDPRGENIRGMPLFALSSEADGLGASVTVSRSECAVRFTVGAVYSATVSTTSA